MVVIGDLVAMAVIGVHDIDDVLMGVAMFFDLGMMFGDDLCQFCEVMGNRTRVRRRSMQTAKAMVSILLRYPVIRPVIPPALVGFGPLA